MRFFRLFVAALWLVGFGLCATPALALGTLTFSPPIWSNRDANRPLNVLNRKDCTNGDGAVATFSYSVKNAPGGVFEVWSGAGCDNKDNRSASALTKTCARVATGSVVETSIQLNFRDMIKAYGSTTDAGPEACDTPQGAGLQVRTLFFVVYDQGTFASLVTSTPASWQFKYDITAPPPPSNVSALAGDKTLVASFTPPSGETNLLHYHFYCSPKGDPPVTVSAGTAGSAGTDTGGTAGTNAVAGSDTGGTAGTDSVAGTDTGGTAGTDAVAGTAGTDSSTGTAGTTSVTTLDPTCTSGSLVPGSTPPAFSQPGEPQEVIDCGTIGALTSTNGETNPVLENDNQYAIAIATEDDANNIGVLSGLACAQPRDVTGFFEAYNKAGGQGGGGYCTFAPAHRDALAMGIALLLGACALWRRRR